MVTICPSSQVSFSSLNRKKVEAQWRDIAITSDAGLLLVREIDKKLGLTRKLARCIQDGRHPSYIKHSLEALLKQRIYALTAGYEDVNDHDWLSQDIGFQTAVGKETPLASSATLSRFENSIDKASLLAMSHALIEHFIAGHKEAPKELVLDFDPTDIVLHGQQEKRHYSAYYKAYCFLPLHVFCGEHLLVSYLRSSGQDAIKHAAAILRLLVKRFRTVWPDVRITFRGDSAFARKHLLHWCDQQGVYYYVGLAQNARLNRMIETDLEEAKQSYETHSIKVKYFKELRYQSSTWQVERRVIAKIEHQEKGENKRYVVTNVEGAPPQAIYEQGYCPRGNMENGIKQLKLDLYSDRSSCQFFRANAFRLLLSSVAYGLLVALKQEGLSGTKWVRSYCGTLRLKLLKVAAIVVRNSRRIQFFLSKQFPYQSAWRRVVKQLVPT